MDTVPRRHAAVFVVPMIIALVMAQHVAGQVRTVDFLVVFVSGALFGITLLRLVQILRRGHAKG